MSPEGESALESWREFGVAVEFVAHLERPGLTVWDALAEALLAWLDQAQSEHTDPRVEPDQLRSALRHVLDTTPEVGAPGGVRIETILDAAVSEWIATASVDVNDGRPFQP